MSLIIVDFGSANTCRNDLDIVKRMITEFASIDPHNHDIVIKWQLFDNQGKNIPLQRWLFAKAYELAWGFGYETTASVFDMMSLDFLLKFEVPFIKIANNKDAYKLIGKIPDDIRIIKSVPDSDSFSLDCMCCVSQYPAKKEKYEKTFKEEQLRQGISDHTVNFDLYEKYKPELYEFHFCLEHDNNKDNPDGGLFARTPRDLKEIL